MPISPARCLMILPSLTVSTIQFQIVTPLAHNTKFYWRVRAVNTDDEEGNWSAVRYFRTIVDAPALLSPANASPAGSLKPVFDWNDAAGPGAITNYTIQVSANPAFATLLVNKSAVSSTYTQLTDLPAGKTLYWRVKVNGANGPLPGLQFLASQHHKTRFTNTRNIRNTGQSNDCPVFRLIHFTLSSNFACVAAISYMFLLNGF